MTEKKKEGKKERNISKKDNNRNRNRRKFIFSQQFYVTPNRKWLHNAPLWQFLLLTSPYTLEPGKFCKKELFDFSIWGLHCIYACALLMTLLQQLGSPQSSKPRKFNDLMKKLKKKIVDEVWTENREGISPFEINRSFNSPKFMLKILHMFYLYLSQ